VVAADTFTDVDIGDALSYAATRADGSALPAWLTFNASTRTFSGTPLNGDVGTLSTRVTVTDTGGLSTFDTFDIAVNSGSGGQTIIGTAGNDVRREAPAMTPWMAAGADTLKGGLGNDVYVVDTTSDIISDSGGIDTVRTTLAAYVLPAAIENVTFAGIGNFTGTGNSSKNVLVGGTGNDILNGRAGADTMTGGWATTATRWTTWATWWSRVQAKASTRSTHRSPTHWRRTWRT